MNNILQNSINVNEIFDEIEKEIYGFIYKITNLITGKIYIGQTKHSVEKRWKGHKKTYRSYKSNQYIHKSMRKYGIENFIIEQIDIAHTKEELNMKEEQYILSENCLTPNGYNLKTGGYTNQWCDESREKLSKTKKAQNLTHSDELKQYWSEMKKGIPKSKEHREKIGTAHKNKKKSEQHKRKISKTLMGHNPGKWYCNFETLEQKRIQIDEEIPEGFVLGKLPLSDEHKNKLSKASPFKNTKYYHNPETNEEIRINIEITPPPNFILGRLKTSK
jgi:group I intron endonuclease